MPLIEQDGAPVAALGAGTWLLRGEYRWSAMPQGMALPAQIGVLRLSIGGQVIAQPRIDAGVLRLGAGDAPGESRLELDVMRRIRDGVPAVIETRLAVRASGGSREVSLGRVLPEGTRPVGLSAELPARLGPEGDLVVQVRPGTWTLTLEALYEGPMEALQAPSLPAPWPEVEYWAVQADEQVRAITLSGPPGVDPGRTPLPEEWRALPAFRVGPGESLLFEGLRRGQPKPPGNELRLSREMWLDHDGEGFTVRDSLSGKMQQGWRLDLQAPGLLGQATLYADGTLEDQVITTGTGGTGVELRAEALNLQATSRLSGRSDLPAVGWSTAVDNLDVVLHLPPGWRLLGATGADQAPGSLIERWSLWGVLWAMVLTAGTARAAGLVWGAAMAAGLLLSEVSGVAPVIAWLPILGALLAPGGAWFQAARRLSLGLLGVFLLPGIYLDLERGLFPHIGGSEASGSSVADLFTLSRQSGDILTTDAEELQAHTVELVTAKSGYQQESTRGYYANSQDASGKKQDQKLRNISLQRDPNAVAQTGPGLPQWRGETYRLGWEGQVRADQAVRLFLVSPGMMGLWRLLECLLLGAVALRLSGARREERWTAPPAAPHPAPAAPPEPESPASGAPEAVSGVAAPTGPRPAAPTLAPATPEGRSATTIAPPLLALLFLAGLPGAARAQDNAGDAGAERAAPAELAEWEAQLRRGLCAAGCVDVPTASVSVSDRELRLTASVHVAARGSWPLPGPASAWVPASVRVDGAESWALARQEDGFLHLRLEPGVHRVELVGPLPPESAITLQFSQPPRWMEAQGIGWSFEGIRPDGSVAGSLQLIRDAGGAVSSADLQPWLEVRRFLDLGFPWKVRTEVRRIGASDRALTVRVPLLAGESVTDDGLVVKDGLVQVSLGREAQAVEWLSTLDAADQFTLQAPTGVSWTEVWELSCSPVFACTTEGFPPIAHVQDGGWLPRWRPWPGESLTVSVRRPDAAAGQTLTIDLAEQTWDPGPRLLVGTLKLRLRSSQGGKLPVHLPPGAELRSVTVDGQSRPMEDRAGLLALPLRPGPQTWEISWRQPVQPSLLQTLPDVPVEAPLVNVRVALEPPQGRWLLWASAGPQGPVLLWWARALILLAGAAAAARWIGVLVAAEWAVLAMLCSALPLPAAGCIAFYGAVLRLTLDQRAGKLSPAWEKARLPLLGLSWFGALCAVGMLLIAAAEGLLSDPDMLVTGPGSSRFRLAWFADQTDGHLPQPVILSLPLWCWRLLFLGLGIGAGAVLLRVWRRIMR